MEPIHVAVGHGPQDLFQDQAEFSDEFPQSSCESSIFVDKGIDSFSIGCVFSPMYIHGTKAAVVIQLVGHSFIVYFNNENEISGSYV